MLSSSSSRQKKKQSFIKCFCETSLLRYSHITDQLSFHTDMENPSRGWGFSQIFPFNVLDAFRLDFCLGKTIVHVVSHSHHQNTVLSHTEEFLKHHVPFQHFRFWIIHDLSVILVRNHRSFLRFPAAEV